MKVITVKLGEDGKIDIPAEFQKALGMTVRDELVMSMDNGSIVIFSHKKAILYAQEQIAKYTTSGRQLCEEIIAERRIEAELE